MRFARFLSVLLFIAIFAISPALRAQEAAEPVPVYVDKLEREYKFYPGGKIGISIASPGSLKIIGWNRGSVRMEAEIKVYSLSDEKARALLEKSPVRVRYTNSASTIQVTETPELRGLLEVNLTVHVPAARTDLAAQIKKGDFVIDTVNGWVEATLAEGNINVTAIDGYFSGKTMNGSILANLSGNRWSGQGFTAVTQKGDIELILPEKYSAVLQLDTGDGKITVDFPAQEVEGELIPIEAVVRKKAQQLRVRVGAGGAPMRLGTQSGDVSFRSAD
ncbi:MAG: DUF4097 domain-containing protein [Acidobacteriota bacterium]|nr:DUF4097 domain-containing protein [Acidobacteriota bacterium]